MAQKRRFPLPTQGEQERRFFHALVMQYGQKVPCYKRFFGRVSGAARDLYLINREKIDAIREAIRELERTGLSSVQGSATRKDACGVDYLIFEQPQPPTPDLPTLENPTQLNKDIQRTDLPKKEKIITDGQSTQFLSFPLIPHLAGKRLRRQNGKERKWHHRAQ